MFFGQTIRNEFFLLSSSAREGQNAGWLAVHEMGKKLPFPISSANTVIGKQWRRQRETEPSFISYPYQKRRCCRSIPSRAAFFVVREAMSETEWTSQETRWLSVIFRSSLHQ
jgi:hypothetical protein